MQIIATTTVTRDGYRWPSETISADLAVDARGHLDDRALHDAIVSAVETADGSADDLQAGDWVDIEITHCAGRPYLIGAVLTWIVPDDHH